MKFDIILNEIGKADGFDKTIYAKLQSANARESNELVIVKCTDEKSLRIAAENKNADILIGLESIEGKDSLHGRNSGMNEVICKLLKKNSIAMGISFKSVLNSANKALILGRIMQNIELCRKYKVEMVLASFAESKWDLRSANELVSFGVTLGMTPLEAKNSLVAAAKILETKRDKKLPAGVKLV